MAGKPSVSLSDVEPIAAIKLNKTGVGNLERLIQSTPKTAPEMPDLLLSLATHHMQDHRYWSAPGPKPSERKKMAARAANSGLKALARLIQNHPTYARIDEAIYGQSRLLASTGNHTAARKSAMRLLQNYPHSTLVPNVYASVGDYFAAQNKPLLAAQFYAKVLQFPKSRIYSYGLYRAAWSKIERGQATQALELLVRAVHSAKAAPVARVGAVARGDIVRLYASVGHPAKAGAFFRRVDPAAASAMLHALAGIYVRRGDREHAETVRQQAASQGASAP